MFTKTKHTGRMTVDGYKKVVDWDAVWGTIFVAFVVIVILANL